MAPANNEAGFTFHPDLHKHQERAEVLKELEEAKADGSYDYLQRGFTGSVRDTGPGKTREEVINELVNMTPEERAHERASISAIDRLVAVVGQSIGLPGVRRCMPDDQLWRPSHVLPFVPIARASAK